MCSICWDLTCTGIYYTKFSIVPEVRMYMYIYVHAYNWILMCVVYWILTGCLLSYSLGYTQYMPHEHINFGPLHPPFSKYKSHNDQDFISHNCSFKWNELVVTTTSLLTVIGHQRSVLSQTSDFLVLYFFRWHISSAEINCISPDCSAESVYTWYDCGEISSLMVFCSFLSGVHTKTPGTVGDRSGAQWRCSKVAFCFCPILNMQFMSFSWAGHICHKLPIH